MLSRIKMDYPEIRRALLEIDDGKLSFDDLKALSRQLPTSEEVCIMCDSQIALSKYDKQVERIKSFEDVSKLAKADQYFHQVGLTNYLRWLFLTLSFILDHEYPATQRAPGMHAISSET